MTLSELRVKLETVLAPMLGKFTTENGGTQPAIYVGEPPQTWNATGLECNIEIVKGFSTQPIYQGALISEDVRIRLISHGLPAYQNEAVRAVVQTLPDSVVTEIPRNVRLGILAQHLITLRS